MNKFPAAIAIDRWVTGVVALSRFSGHSSGKSVRWAQ